MKPARFQSFVKLKLEPELRSAIEAAAERDKTTMSEFLRREIRSAVARISTAADVGAAAGA